MSELSNPYASPSSTPGDSLTQLGATFDVAGKGARFVNLLIDSAVYYAISFAAGVVIALSSSEAFLDYLEKVPNFLLGLPIYFGYYFTLEATTGRTLGKMATGTMVINEQGQPPSPGQVAGRTLCRLIPFEAFSILFASSEPRGWHDSIPKTYVVKSR
ncbi:RDD family protein [Pirellulaceae bacterium SH449]